MERRDAFALGLVKYNTGRVCRNGHAADRYVSSGACEDCLTEIIYASRGKYAEAARERRQVRAETRRAEVDAVRSHREALRAAVLEGTLDILLIVGEDEVLEAQACAEALCRLQFPEVPAGVFRPRRVGLKRVGDGLVRIAVRVPRQDVATAYAIGEQLRARCQKRRA